MTERTGALADKAMKEFLVRREEQEKQRADAEARRKADEAELDHEALERTVGAPIHEWFENVDWTVVDRHATREGGVLVKDPESGLLFRVDGHDGKWSVSVGTEPRGRFTRVYSAADVGGFLWDLDTRHRMHEVTENA